MTANIPTRAPPPGPAFAISVILGLGSSISLPIGGNLFITELLAPLLALYAMFNMPRVKTISRRSMIIALLMIFGALMMASQDIFRFPTYDVKVWVRFLVVPIMIASFAVLISLNLIKPLIFSAFLIIGLGIAFALKQQFIQNGDIIRFNIGTPFVWMALIFADRLSVTKRYVAIAALIVLTIVTGIRSLGLMILIVAVVQFLSANFVRISPSAKGLLAAGVLISTTLVGSSLFHELALSGALGEKLHTKELWQTQGGEGFMSVARPHTKYELEAIKAAPVLGSGSTPRNPEVAGAFLQMARAQGRDYAIRQLTRDDVQTHSLIFDGWIRGGILSGLGWGLAFIAALALVFRAIGQSRPLGYGLNFLMIYLLWSIPFSPLSPQARILTALSIALACQALANWNSSPQRQPSRGH
jgi:hypothetical protein